MLFSGKQCYADNHLLVSCTNENKTSAFYAAKMLEPVFRLHPKKITVASSDNALHELLKFLTVRPTGIVD